MSNDQLKKIDRKRLLAGGILFGFTLLFSIAAYFFLPERIDTSILRSAGESYISSAVFLALITLMETAACAMYVFLPQFGRRWIFMAATIATVNVVIVLLTLFGM